MPDLDDIFAFLDELRLSGETNMWGAAPYVEAAFGMPAKEAKAATIAWMKTFDGKSTVAARVAKAKALQGAA